ncbi:hypothetical protein DPV78_003788 [Talaromyces pinophilus]|nr:hypothetical protein DPV78_003788 [Talaromyces pinophilus]
MGASEAQRTDANAASSGKLDATVDIQPASGARDLGKPGFPAGHRQLLEEKLRKLEEELQSLRDGGGGGSGGAGTNSDTRAIDGLESPRDLPATRPPVDEVPGPTSQRTRQTHERQPPTDLVMSLTSLFFRHIHPWFPFLDIQRVCIAMSASDEPTLLHYALFGVSLPYSFDSRLDQKSSDSFWKYAKRQILLEVLEEPSFNSLEALTVLILDLSGMTTGPQVWGPLAIATTLLVKLRNGGAQVFRTSIAESDSNALSSVDLLTPHFVCGYQLQLLDVSRKLHMLHLEYASLRQDDDSILNWIDQFQKCSAELTAWVQCLPSCLQLNIGDDGTLTATALNFVPSVVMLHAYYHALVIHTHCLLSEPSYEALLSQPFDDTRAESQTRCVYSVNLLVEIASRWSAKNYDKLGWPVAWAVWIGARYMLVQEFHCRHIAPEKFSILLDCLRRMSPYWQISGKYWRLLKQAATELHGNLPNAHGEQRIVQLLADFRISTSDLEDQFRVDPILRYESTGENPGSMANDVLDLDAHQPLSDTNILYLADQTSDNWFHIPLFASSAYQQDYDVSL